MKTIYRLEWYLEREGMIKTRRFSSREVAERHFGELNNVLGKGCWIALDEFVEENEEEGFKEEYNQLDFVEI